MIIEHWSKEFRSQYGELWPSSYFCFDTETTGFKRDLDVIVEWGHCTVKDRKPVDRINVLINWFGSGLVPDDWLETRLKQVGRKIQAAKGRPWHITPQRMREEGVPVEQVLPWIFELLSSLISQNEILVAHNGWNYDVQMLQKHAEDFMDVSFHMPENQLIDTGAIEKASQLLDDPKVYPKTGEAMKTYFSRIAYCKAPGVFWSLDPWCIEKYRLAEKHGADPSNAHQAGYDAWLLYLLMEEYRQLLESGEAGVPVIPDAKPSANPNVSRLKPRKLATNRFAKQKGQKRRRGQRNR